MPREQASGAAGRAAQPAGYDEVRARREGWMIVRCGPREDGTERIEIRRYVGAEGCRFQDDESARHYVVTQARAGSACTASPSASAPPWSAG